MAERLIAVTDPALFQSGLAPSVHKTQAPLWVDGENVVFEDGSVRKSPGYLQLGTELGTLPISGMQDVLVGDIPMLAFGDADLLYVYDGTEITEDGGTYSGSLSREAYQLTAFQDTGFQLVSDPRANLWSMTDWGSWVVATNGIDTPQVNKFGGSGFVNIGGTPPSYARIVKRYKNFIVFFSTDLGNRYAEWSDVDDAEDYVNGAAGNLFIRDLDSEIQCVQEIGDALAVYSNNSMVIFQYIGPDFWFGAKKVLEGIGATGIHSVVATRGRNYGISKAGVWVTDGVSYEYISPPFVRKWIQDNVNFGYGDKIAGMLNEDRNSIEWGVPINGASDNNYTIIHNYQNKSWTFKDTSMTAGLKKGTLGFPLFGDTDGKVYVAEYGLNSNADAWTVFVQTKPMDAGNPNAWKNIEYVVLHITDLVQEGTVTCKIGVQDDLEDAITWGTAFEVDEQSRPVFLLDQNLAGRYVSLYLEASGLDEDFKFSGFEIYGSVTGADA